MTAMIKVEMEKLFCSRWFYLSILGMVLGMHLNGWELMQYSLHDTVNNLFLLSLTTGFSLLRLFLCVAGGGISFCMEQKWHNARYVVLRGNATSYAVGKVISASIGGYLVSFLGCILGGLSMTLPLYLQQKTWGVITSCVPEMGLSLLRMLIQSLLGSLLSVLALLVSLFFSDLFVVMVAPIVIYYAWLNITGWFPFPDCLDIVQIYFAGGPYTPGRFVWGRYWQALGYAFLFTACIVYMLGLVIIRQMKRRVEHG